MFVALLAWLLRSLEMCSQTRAAAVMANIPQADIDPSGVFKYVLIRVHSKEEGDDTEVDVVRGYGWAEYHGESESPNSTKPTQLFCSQFTVGEITAC